MTNCNSDQTTKNTLPDVGDVEPIGTIPRKKQILRILTHASNPCHFYCDGMSVEVEFAEDGPALQDKLTDFFIRQKSGL